MTGDQKKRELALYRLRQANEALDEAKYLLEGGKSSRVIINRAYYAMFYAVLGLLVFEEFSSSKHSGILAFLNQNFIKTGRLPQELGRAINIAFELRQKADYKEFSELSYEQVTPIIAQAEEFVLTVTDYLKQTERV